MKATCHCTGVERCNVCVDTSGHLGNRAVGQLRNILPVLTSNPFVGKIAYADLIDAIPWEQKDSVPRQECWMANHPEPYTYGNDKYYRVYQPQMLPPVVQVILRSLNKSMDLDLDCCMANRYDDEQKHLGWHADDSPEMDHNSPIVIVSFGATREIHFRPIGDTGEAPYKVELRDGSACVMLPQMQKYWHHKIPKHSAPCGPRVSLTFRKLVTP